MKISVILRKLLKLVPNACVLYCKITAQYIYATNVFYFQLNALSLHFFNYFWAKNESQLALFFNFIAIFFLH